MPDQLQNCRLTKVLMQTALCLLLVVSEHLDNSVARHTSRSMLLQGHTDNVGGLAFSADGSALATACEDRVIRIFKLNDVRAKNMGFMKHNMTTTPVDVAFGSAPNLLAVTARGKTSFWGGF